MKKVIRILILCVTVILLPIIVKADVTSVSCSSVNVKPGDTIACSYNVTSATSYVISSLSADIVQTSNITATSFVKGASEGYGEDISNGKIDYLTGASTSNAYKIGDLTFKVGNNCPNGEYYIGVRNVVLYEDDWVTTHEETEHTVKVTVSGGSGNTSQTNTSQTNTSQTNTSQTNTSQTNTSQTNTTQTNTSSQSSTTTTGVSNPKTGSNIILAVVFLTILSGGIVIFTYNNKK